MIIPNHDLIKFLPSGKPSKLIFCIMWKIIPREGGSKVPNISQIFGAYLTKVGTISPRIPQKIVGGFPYRLPQLTTNLLEQIFRNQNWKPNFSTVFIFSWFKLTVLFLKSTGHHSYLTWKRTMKTMMIMATMMETITSIPLSIQLLVLASDSWVMLLISISWIFMITSFF